MDIYKYAADINYSADYMDMSTGNVYMIQEYGKALKFGLPTPGIRVRDCDGNDIGYAVNEALIDSSNSLKTLNRTFGENKEDNYG